MDTMIEDGFVLSRQIMFVPHMVCKIMVWQYQGKPCFNCEPNVRKLPWGAKTNHVVSVNSMVDIRVVAKAGSLTFCTLGLK